MLALFALTQSANYGAGVGLWDVFETSYSHEPICQSLDRPESLNSDSHHGQPRRNNMLRPAEKLTKRCYPICRNNLPVIR